MGAESEGEGVRWTMEWRVREGVRAMKGMWKILAERLGDVSDGDLIVRCECEYGGGDG